MFASDRDGNQITSFDASLRCHVLDSGLLLFLVQGEMERWRYTAKKDGMETKGGGGAMSLAQALKNGKKKSKDF